MSYLRIRNWERYQHYRDRRPPWVKFYVELLDDLQIRSLPLPTRFLMCQLLLLAARHDNAILKNSEAIANDLRMKPEDVHEGLEELLRIRWIQETRTPRRASKPASSALAKRYTRDRDRERPPLPPTGGNENEQKTTQNRRDNGTNPRALQQREHVATRALHFVKTHGHEYPDHTVLADELRDHFPSLNAEQVDALLSEAPVPSP